VYGGRYLLAASAEREPAPKENECRDRAWVLKSDEAKVRGTAD